MKCSVASFSTMDNDVWILTGEYEPAVSTKINYVPESTSTCLNDIPFVVTFFPDGRFDYVKLFKTNVLPLSYKPTTATVAPSHFLYWSVIID